MTAIPGYKRPETTLPHPVPPRDPKDKSVPSRIRKMQTALPPTISQSMRLERLAIFSDYTAYGIFEGRFHAKTGVMADPGLEQVHLDTVLGRAALPRRLGPFSAQTPADRQVSPTGQCFAPSSQEPCQDAPVWNRLANRGIVAALDMVFVQCREERLPVNSIPSFPSA